MLLSILIPVYNEENTVKQLLEKVGKVSLPKGFRKELVIVNDGSTDKTRRILNSLLKDRSAFKNSSIILFHHDTNKGKGAAIKTALKQASGDYLIVQDADLEYDPEDFIRLLDMAVNKKAKVVFGTRLKNYPLNLWGKNKTVLPSHWVANTVLTWLTNVLYGSSLTDMETCYKLFHYSVFEKITLNANRFDFEPEVTAKVLRNGFKIIEIEIKTAPRSHREGKKIKWQDGVVAIWALLKYRVMS
jgi:glycosyltransferase involved in cell wall biosynthesis